MTLHTPLHRRTSTSTRSPHTADDLLELLDTTELPATDVPGEPVPAPRKGAHRTPPTAFRRPTLYLAVAAAGALMVNVLTAGQPAAHADLQSVSIAKQLGVAGQSTSSVRPLQQLVASRSQRDTVQSVAALDQSRADQAELQKRAAAAAAAKAAAEAAAKAKAEAAAAAAAAAATSAAAAAPAPTTSAAPAAGGSYQDYALSKLGGDSGQMSCLENLWGKESGWNPNAQNPSSSAYGIPQFLDSTWASTGIAKTSDGYRQIDAGLIYLDDRYGSPCGGWAHSQSTGWY
jgi:hypothetical protein